MGSMAMGFADFPIEIFKKGRAKREALIARKEVKTESRSVTPKPSSRSQSQVDLASEETTEPGSPSGVSLSQPASFTLSPKTSYESTERSSTETATTADTSLNSASSLGRGQRENSLKQALRGTLNRSRSTSRDRSQGFRRSLSRDRSSTGRTESPSRQPREIEPSALTMDNAGRAGKGIARIVGAGLKSPMDFTLGLARGFHNAPKLYGDTTVRPQAKVTDLQSGLKAATKVRITHRNINNRRNINEI